MSSIRNGIQDYQTPLIARVLEELERLQRTYEVEYENTLNSKMSLVRDIPPVSGQVGCLILMRHQSDKYAPISHILISCDPHFCAPKPSPLQIVWARQIEHQVKSLLKRVEDVLGTGWEKTAEGDKLQKMGASLVERVNPQPTFQHWLNEMMNRDLNIQGNVFRIGKDASRGLSLEVRGLRTVQVGKNWLAFFLAGGVSHFVLSLILSFYFHGIFLRRRSPSSRMLFT